MLFNSLQYAVFLPLAVLLYHAVPLRAKMGVLLFTSYLFYASWSPIYLLLIGGLTFINYLLGFAIARAPTDRGKVGFLWVGVAVNLLALGYYKYVGFLLGNVDVVYEWLGLPNAPTPWSPILPLGLSFFVFEFIHYLVDVRNGHSPMRSIVQFAVFAAFFPTQVAGPIKRYEAFLPQMLNPAPFSWGNLGEGARLIVIGLFKKIAVADNLAPMVELGFHAVAGGSPNLHPIDAWLAVMAFTLQIYFDFSGYTDMGRGSALMLGYTVPENFRRPYLAQNFSDFWRRWHISLSTWLRDYLYIALGGNRHHHERNLIVTMVLGGLWHGANWTFIIWGAYHGILQVVSSRIRRWRNPQGTRGSAGSSSVPGVLLNWGITFVLVAIGWVFFRADTFSQAVAMLGSMAGLARGAPIVLVLGQRLTIVVAVGGMLLVEYWLERRERQAAAVARTAPATPSETAGTPAAVPVPARLGAGALILRPVGLTLLFMLTLLMQPAVGPRFIYFQF